LARKQLELDNAVAAELAGSEDAVLRALEGHLDCDVFLRGNVLTLEGDADAVEAGTAVVRELSELIGQGHEIAAGTIEAVTRALDQHESASKILEDVVWRHRATKVAPKTVNQKRYVDSIRQNTITFGIGPAGTGKTFLAVALAAAALSRREVNRIILTRPAVEAGERLGFLPGDLMAKVDPYLRPLFDALHDMLEPERVTQHLERGVIEVAPLAFACPPPCSFSATFKASPFRLRKLTMITPLFRRKSVSNTGYLVAFCSSNWCTMRLLFPITVSTKPTVGVISVTFDLLQAKPSGSSTRRFTAITSSSGWSNSFSISPSTKVCRFQNP